jgi:hypothetical protein
MPKRPVEGTKQVLLELPEELVQAAKAFAELRGESFKYVVIEALRRHMAFPPSPPPPPAAPPPPEPFPPAGGSSGKKPPASGKPKRR